MAKSCKRRTKRRSQRGGGLAGNPASAWGWGLGTVGNGWTQFMDSLTLQPNQNSIANQSNNIVPVEKGNTQNMSPKFVGGKRKLKRRGGKRGGNALSQAIVPGSLILMNNALKNFSRNRSRKRRH